MAEAISWSIVTQAAAGHAEARRLLVEATIDDLWALGIRLTRRPDEADDVVQETYARAFASLSGLQPTGRFEGYLARIATNLVLERWRRQRPAGTLAETTVAPDDVEPWQTVATREEQQRQLAAIWAAIGQLGPQPRAAVLLFYAQGESCESIGHILDVPVGTVKTWLHRARNQVRQDAEALLEGEAAVGRPRTGDMA
ncbi:MAG: RNA polymerase sigma factor [Planctomycetes bacterium]|nr:RNA polymerase sigma factor [Planctomycetota bacterium]